MNVRRQVSSTFQDEIPNFVQSESKTSSLPSREARVRVANHRSGWMADQQKLSDRFNTLVGLPRGWDGYAGRPISFSCAFFAANLIERLHVEGVPAPQIVPGSDGTVQIEWHENQFDVEIAVVGPYEVFAVRRSIVTGEVTEIELQTDFTLLSNWIVELKERPRLAEIAGV